MIWTALLLICSIGQPCTIRNSEVMIEVDHVASAGKCRRVANREARALKRSALGKKFVVLCHNARAQT